MFRRIYFSLIGVLALVCLSCDSVPLLAPTNSTVTIDAQSRVIATGESTQVTATVMESGGTPVQNGTLVRFTTTLGRLEPAEAQTRNGIAAATFFAGNDSGVAEVKATSGGAGSTATTTPGTGGTPGTSNPTNSNIVLISVGSAAIDTVTIRANPSVVPSSGGTVTVTATVAGVNGRLLQGIPVNFSSTRGTLSSSSAVSDASGNATVTLSTTGDTDVTATAGSKTSTAVRITALVAPALTLTCAANNCSVPLGQTVTFTATRTTGTLVSSTLDFGDGTSVDLGALSGATTVPHLYGQAGTYTARLTARDANGETTSAVQVVQIIPVTMTLSASVTTPAPTRTVTATATVTGGTATQYQWSWGDATALTTTTTATTTHNYAAAGQYDIVVTATLQGGGTIVANTTIVVP